MPSIRCAARYAYRQKEVAIKKQLKHGLLVSGAVLSIGAASLGTAGLAQAATSSDTSPNQSIIEKLVSKFNLNKEEVQQLFDEDRTEREAERTQVMNDKINDLVTEGKLTQEQADKLIAKAKELQTQRESNRDSMNDKTDEERKEAMKAERESFTQWLSDNDIDEEYGRLIMGHGPGGRGHGGPPPSQNSEDQ